MTKRRLAVAVLLVSCHPHQTFLPASLPTTNITSMLDASTPPLAISALPASGSIRGNMNVDNFRLGMRAAAPAFYSCYQQSLLHTPTLTGVLKLHFILAEDGMPSQVTPNQGLSPELDTCVVAVLSGLHFPLVVEHGAIIEITYPLFFQP